MIIVKNVFQNYELKTKEPGFLASLKSLWNPKKETKQALKNINLQLSPGETIGLIGANGAGKTTLIKILSGIIYPSEGEVSVLGFNPWSRDPLLQKQMALIMGQKAQLWWDLPALDCFDLLREIYQVEPEEFKARVKELAVALNLEQGQQLKTPIRKLSLGERMKVELMASLLHRPNVVYLDEPTIGLDISSQKAIRKFIQNYQKQYKPMMIITSHYMQDIEELCERVVIMKSGEIIFDGKIKELFERDLAKNKEQNLNNQKRIHLRGEFSRCLQDKNAFEKGLVQAFPNHSISIASMNEDESELTLVCPQTISQEVTSYMLANFEIEDIRFERKSLEDIIEKILKSGTGE